MSTYGTYGDDFYLNMNLNTEMEVTGQRETLLHFFEQIQKRYPSMKNFYSRDRGEYVLEEEKDGGQYRWAAVDPRRVCSGHVNPDRIDDAIDQHAMILDLVPYSLGISSLDCESLNLMLGFDFNYRGNHNQLVAEALGVPAAVEGFAGHGKGTVVGYEPSLQISLDDECRMQARISVETRTSAYHIRTSEFPEEQISVYLTIRRYGSLLHGTSYVEAIRSMHEVCIELADDYLVKNVLQPLQQAIAIR